MKVEFYRADDPDTVLATGVWEGGRATLGSEDPDLQRALTDAFRSTPVLVAGDDSYRGPGTSGPVVVQPGSLEWFRAAAQVRAPAETGLAARLVPGVREGGFDPAAGYRSFESALERLDARGA
jgi:hypothetical protein